MVVVVVVVMVVVGYGVVWGVRGFGDICHIN